MSLADQLKLAHVPKELAFPLEVYRNRLQAVREAMSREGIELMLVSNITDLCYLTGYQTLHCAANSCLAIPRDGDPFIQVPDTEVPAVLIHGPMEDIESYNWYEATEPGTLLGPLLRRRLPRAKSIGVQLQGGLSAIDFQRLQAALPNTELRDHSNLVFELRVIKSPAEVSYLRKAGTISQAGIKAARAALSEARTDNDVAAAAYYAMTVAGSEYFGYDPIITTGHRSGLIHTTFKRQPLKPGDNVFMEFGGVFNRYCAPMARTSVLGKPSDDSIRLAEISKRAFRLLLEELKPGRTGHDVAVAIRDQLAAFEGTGAYYHAYFGYSVGISFPPTWVDGPMYIAEGSDAELLPGMTFHTARINRIPGKLGVGLSESILVTDGGCEVLTGGLDFDLDVVGV